MKIALAGVLLLCLGVACAERASPQRSLGARASSVGGNQPYWFLGAPRKGQGSIQAVAQSVEDYSDDSDDSDDEQQAAFVVVQDDDDIEAVSSFDDEIVEDNFENDDDDDEDSELSANIIGVFSLTENNGVIELEAREFDDDVDESDGESDETAVYLPRGVLENLPKGSVMALVDDSDSEGRAVRIVRRRVGGGGGGGRRRIRRRGNNVVRRRRPIRRRRGGNKGGKRRKVIRRRGGPQRRGNRRRINNRRRRPQVIRL